MPPARHRLRSFHPIDVMNRKQFLFSQSDRLYKQSEESATYLLGSLVDEPPFGETASVLSKTGAHRFIDHAACAHATKLAWRHLMAVSGALDPRYVIPALFEAIEQYYYGPKKTKDAAPWAGTAMKIAVAAVWANRKVATATLKAHAQMKRVVSAAGAWEQLSGFCDMARAFDFGAAEFSPLGIHPDNREDEEVRRLWHIGASKRGMALRTLKSSENVVWQDMSLFLDAAAHVLKGDQPSNITLFKGTLFAEIKSQPDFWLGLSIRLHFMAHASRFRSLGRQDSPVGISIFEPFEIVSRFIGNDQKRVTAATHAMFWQPDWHRQRMARYDFLHNLVVERPAIRIDNQTFVAGIVNLGDSINCFIEHSVFRMFGYTCVPIAEEAFRLYVSKPFELRTRGCFSDRGWRVDGVSEEGTWTGLALEHISSRPIPGEVDVLALHPSGNFAILAECKVLGSPLNQNKLLNIRQKLGSTDSESFHSKLERKAQWLKETTYFANVEILPLLIVDEGAVMGKNAPNLVLDIEALSKFLDEICEK